MPDSGSQTTGVDLIAQLRSRIARSSSEILSGGRVENGARGADHQARAASRLTIRHRLRNITPLRSYAGNEQRHVTYDCAHFRQLSWIRRTDDEHAITTGIPALCGELGDRVI
jgi:hypothetical protein